MNVARYGWEDPKNCRLWTNGGAEVRCWCGEASDLIRQGEHFLCSRHRKAA